MARLAAGRRAGPVIVAGSTGSSRATARLIGAVARLPQGAVVLPGLDQALDDGGLDRHRRAMPTGDRGRPSAGRSCAACSATSASTAARSRRSAPCRPRWPLRGRLVSEALRPADTTRALARVTGIDRHGGARRA